VDGQSGQAVGAGWSARLELEYARQGARTTLVRRRHVGPLAVQRPFHPERDGTCHSYVLHPPGGVVAGDRLELAVEVGPGARALLTAPSATKLYRSGRGREAEQLQRFTLAEGARLEWLPQETIAYDGAAAALATRVELAPGASFIGCEILCLGRPVADERFTRGRIAQRLEVFRAGEPLLIERACYTAGSPPLAAAYGMHAQPVVGSLVCIGPERSPALLEELRALLAALAPGESAVSELAFACVCRYRGASVLLAQRALRAAWALLRRDCFASEAVAPRIWAT
jgi:urease accessory protein